MMLAWWVKPVATLVVLAALLGAVTAFISHQRALGFEQGQAESERDYEAGMARAAAEAAALAERKQIAVENSHVKDLERANLQIAAGLAARTELERLRARLRDPRPSGAAASAAAGPGPDDTPRAYGLLEACAGRYEEVAGDAGRLAGQVIGLQGFVLANQIGGMPTATPVGERPRAGLESLATQPTTEPPGLHWGAAAPPDRGAP